jgi:hypothetical protein
MLSGCHLMIACAGSFTSLLRELVAEFTLTDNPANTTTSMLRAMCHVDDSVILGSWLQETDHKAIEDQVSKAHTCTSASLGRIIYGERTSWLEFQSVLHI